MNWTKAARSLGVVRDAVLILVGFIYACGYVVWSLFSFSHQLGARSALDAQYFVAGTIPALAIGASLWLFGVLRRLARVKSASFKHVFVMWLVVGVLTYLVNGGPSLGLVAVLFPILILAVTLALATTASALDRNDMRLFSWTLAGGSAVAVLLTLMMYAAVFYDRIPMELGGGLPRCVVLEVDGAKIGSTALESLHSIQNLRERPVWEKQLLEERPQTVEVYLWGMTDRWALLGDGGDGRSYRRVEIPTDAISAMIRCSDGQ